MENINKIALDLQKLYKLVSELYKELQENPNVPHKGIKAYLFYPAPNQQKIDRAFKTRNFHDMTTIVVQLAKRTHQFINHDKALKLLEVALNSPLNSSEDEHGVPEYKNVCSSLGIILKSCYSELYECKKKLREHAEKAYVFKP